VIMGCACAGNRHMQGSRRMTRCEHGIACSGNHHAQMSRRITRCKFGLPLVQRFRENASCLSIGRSGRPLRGRAHARRVAPRRGPEGARPASDLGRTVRIKEERTRCGVNQHAQGSRGGAR
jgi:hypothetical protein